MQTGEATVENNVEFSQKSKISELVEVSRKKKFIFKEFLSDLEEKLYTVKGTFYIFWRSGPCLR